MFCKGITTKNTICHKKASSDGYCHIHISINSNINKYGLCGGLNCQKRASFNFFGKTELLFCALHKIPGMINITVERCKENGCSIIPSFNYKNEKKGILCEKHMKDGMICVKTIFCQENECPKRASFNFPNETKKLYCSRHKKIGMINVTIKCCMEPNCSIGPIFNFPNETKRLYCNKHKKTGMINIKNKRCLELKCDIIPVFNYPNEKKGLYCREHKTEGMINVVDKRCIELGCLIQPIFNYITENKGLYCCKHKRDEMVDVININCQASNCLIRASYNFPNEIKNLFCSEHKKDGMIILHSSRKCHDLNCDITASFNYLNETKGLYCNEHKKDKMIDVVHKHCEEPGCSTTAWYGNLGHSPTRCAKHKILGMIKHPNKKCYINGCNLNAVYGDNFNKVAIRCNVHKEVTDINYIERPCKSCGLEFTLNQNELCPYCEPESIQRVTKIKETEIKFLLDSNNIKYESYDKTIPGGCSRRRPDFLLDCKTHYICLEVDEHQHKAESYSCECVRIFDIVNSLGMPVIFLRYNPDNFRHLNGRHNEITKNKRHEILIRSLKSSFNLFPVDETEFIRIRYLFYDGWVETDTVYETIPYCSINHINNNNIPEFISDDIKMKNKLIDTQSNNNKSIGTHSNNNKLSDIKTIKILNFKEKILEDIDINKLKSSSCRMGYKVLELKNFCKYMKLKISGTKEDLIKRILENIIK